MVRPSPTPALLCALLLASCAAPDGPAPDRSPGPAAPSSGPAAGAPSRPAGAELPSETTRPAGKAQWVAVYESPPGTRYAEQRVIYVDRASVQPQPIEKLTYYLARTREVNSAGGKPKIQELAVLCEGTPSAPATSLRGEGTEESNGSYALKRAPGALTSISQFSTQRIRPDPNNPSTFIVRAICLLGTEGSR